MHVNLNQHNNLIIINTKAFFIYFMLPTKQSVYLFLFALCYCSKCKKHLFNMLMNLLFKINQINTTALSLRLCVDMCLLFARPFYFSFSIPILCSSSCSWSAGKKEKRCYFVKGFFSLYFSLLLFAVCLPSQTEKQLKNGKKWMTGWTSQIILLIQKKRWHNKV